MARTFCAGAAAGFVFLILSTVGTPSVDNDAVNGTLFICISMVTRGCVNDCCAISMACSMVGLVVTIPS